MPDSLAGFGVQRDQTVCEQIVADPVATIEIRRGRACGNVDNSSLKIERHAGPVVGGATGLPCISWPGVITEFARVRNRVKRPAQLAGANVVSADVSGRGGQGFGIPAADDDQVLVHNSGAAQRDGLESRLASEIF